MLKTEEFYKALYEKDINIKEDVLKILLDEFNDLLTKKIENINICIEILLLLSYLSNQNEAFKIILEKNQTFLKLIHSVIKLYTVNLCFIYLGGSCCK
jgi:hypothetical protein